MRRPDDRPEGRVSTLNIPAWRDFPLRGALEARYGRTVVVDNDAKALARRPNTGSGPDRARAACWGWSSRPGWAAESSKRACLIHGVRGNAGHVGHIVAYRDGPPCECGSRGCVEGGRSGTGLATRARARSSRGCCLSFRNTRPAQDIVAAARAGEPTAAQLVEEAGTAVGRGIAAAAVLFDLDRVVIGGGVALGAGDLLMRAAASRAAEDARLEFARGIEDRVLLSDLGIAGPLAGLPACFAA